jgi:hypothetical protein
MGSSKYASRMMRDLPWLEPCAEAGDDHVEAQRVAHGAVRNGSGPTPSFSSRTIRSSPVSCQ